jgi:type I restriction-modification system DNA methylase subunit
MNGEAMIFNLADDLHKTGMRKQEWLPELVRVSYALRFLEDKNQKVTAKAIGKLINDADFVRDKGFTNFSDLDEKTLEMLVKHLNIKNSSGPLKNFILRALADGKELPYVPKALIHKVLDGLSKNIGKNILVADADGSLNVIAEIAESNPKSKVTGYLKNKSLLPIYNYLLEDHKNVTLEVRSILANPLDFTRFDSVFVFVPFGMRLNADHVDGLGNFNLPSRIDSQNLLPSIYSQTNGVKTKLFALITENFLFDTRLKGVRYSLLEQGSLRAIVTNPTETFYPYTRIKTNFLILDGEQKPSDTVLVRNLALEKPTLKSPDFGKIDVSERNVDVETFHSFESWTMATQGADLETYEIKGESASLGDVIESSFRGAPISKSEKSSGEEVKAKLVDYSNLGRAFSSEEIEEIEFKTSRPIERYKLDGGDILLAVRGAAAKVGLAVNAKDPLYPSANLAVIRPKKDKIEPEFLYRFLTSPAGQAACKARQSGSVMMVLSVKDLKSIQVPLPSLSRQKAIVASIKKAERERDQALAKANEKYEQAIEQAYSSMGIKEFNFMEELKKL